MLRVTSKTGMIFAIDLRDVVHMLYAHGVVRFRTVYDQEVTLGGPEWGGPLSADEAGQVFDLWSSVRGGGVVASAPPVAEPVVEVVSEPAAEPVVEVVPEPVVDELTPALVRERVKSAWKKMR